MIQIVCCVIPVMSTHRQQSDLFWKVTIRISINDRYLIAVVKQIRNIICKLRVDPVSLVTDAVILHLNIGSRLEIRSALVTLLRTSENTTQNAVQFKSSAFQCRDLQSSR